MSVQNLSLAALNKNTRFAQTNKFTILAQLVDAGAKIGTTSAPTREEYEALLDKASEGFPGVSLQSLDIMANAWTQLVVIYMKNFFHLTFAEKGTQDFKDFSSLLRSSDVVEHGVKVINLEKEHFLLPCHNVQRELPFNNLEMTLAINYGAFEQIINSVHYFKEMDTSAAHYCGLSRDDHAQVIDLIEEFAQHQYDFLYDLLWGTYDERKSSPSYAQRNQVLNIDHLFKLLR
ncbi:MULTISPECIES: hypothetical protein [Acinetobacter]|uniref:Uncharacterized protein n=1 Tax=Acinetobacter indicus TaxID=756892 RepID=A0A6C0Y7R5_9GAMM|nr:MULTISPECIES: hypothetical protein [Acinetobacter]QIC72123.1 hypothetical protein FSC09_17340 [Acinetobacter indicus]QKQ71475.1 hypothetical protein E5Y90_14685 [Acinetobacter sp. 10FS3-1]